MIKSLSRLSLLFLLLYALAACGESLSVGNRAATVIDANVTKSSGIVAVGSPAPDFAATDLNGKIVKISDLHGKPVIINYWSVY